MTRKRVVHHPGAAWVAALAGAWLAAAACRTMQGPVASGVAPALAAPVEAAVPEPALRVGVRVEVEGVSVSAASGVVVRARVPGETPSLVRTLPRATFRPGGAGRLRLVETGDLLELATASAAGTDELLQADATAYRGILEVRPAEPNLLTVVNVVNLEDYLRGVVPTELSPQAFPQIEALKAQAVAARSYALAHLRDYAPKGFDVCATPACQVYRGISSEHPLTDRAVAETRRVVYLEDGDVVALHRDRVQVVDRTGQISYIRSATNPTTWLKESQAILESEVVGVNRGGLFNFGMAAGVPIRST